MRLSDEIIIRRCLEGDGNAFGLLVAKYQNAVYGLCFHIVGNFADAQDLTQESFVKAYLDLAKMRDPSKFASWLYRITVNTCKIWLRDRKGANDLSLEAVAQAGDEFADGGSPMEHAEAEELRLSIRKAIASLSEKSRLAITLYYIDGLTYEEIGGFLSVSQSAIKSRLHRARRQLKEELISMVEDDFDKHKLPADFPEKVVQEVMVKSVRMEEQAPIVFLQSKGDEGQLLPIWIGLFEGLAITQKLEGQQPQRPMTHDLMANMLKELDMKVVRVVITDLKENTFYAKITIQSNGALKEIDARPSDSIALALRTGAPIFVAKSVLSKSGIRPTDAPTDSEGVPMDPEKVKVSGWKAFKEGRQKYVTMSSLFDIDPKLQSDLAGNAISEELRQEFEGNGILLSSDAAVSCTTWEITDKDKVYVIMRRGDKLNVSSAIGSFQERPSTFADPM